MSEIEKLLKKTDFRNEAKEIAARIKKAGLTLATIADAPRIFGHTLWGHSTYKIIAAIAEAAKQTDEEVALRQAQDAAQRGQDKPPVVPLGGKPQIVTKPLEMPMSEPDKPAGGNK